jgi:predicted HAD superfamily Cof-like phosphohydrolase
MNEMQKQVREFHVAFGVTVNDKPTIPSDNDIELRKHLIQEEFAEFKNASNERDIVDIADALADLLYVVLGSCVTYGIDAEPIFNEVHRSNMTKLWNGKVRYRLDGKVVKPLTYSPADIKKVIECLGEK